MTSTRRVGQGPERPTLAEWLIGFLPVPYVVGSVLLALFFSNLRVLLGAYLDTGDISVAIPPLAPWLLWLFVFVDISVMASVPLAARYMRRQVVRAKASLLPLLPEGEETYLRVFGRISRFGPALAIAAISIAVTVLLPGDLASLGLFNAAFFIVFVLLFFPILGAFIWVYVSSTLGIYFLGREALRLRSYLEDPVLGLRPLGTLSFGVTWPYLAAVGLAALWVSLGVATPALLFFIVGLVVLGVVMFFLPLYAVHRKMVEERRRAEIEVQRQAGEWAKLDPGGRTGDELTLSDVTESIARLTQAFRLDRAERRVADIYRWPFDTRIVGRLAALSLSAVGFVVTRIAAAQFGF